MLDLDKLHSDLGLVNRPVSQARGLPNELYTSGDALALERDRIFKRGWACLGFGCDVPEPGDAMPVDFLGMPLLLVRDHDGQLRVYENVCRHRGMILVSEKKNFGGVIRCPYHSWCYSLDGRLRATPHVGGPGINRHEAVVPDRAGLNEIRAGVFMDLVFVDIDGDAPGFNQWTAPLRSRFEDFSDRPIYHGGQGSGFSLDIGANWKLILENNCESYHLPWVHPGLNSYSKLEDHYHIEAPGFFSGQGTRVYRPDLQSDLSFPDFPDLPGKWDSGAEYASLYPNSFVSVHRDHVWFALLSPKAHDRTVERVEIYYSSEEAAISERFKPLREKNAALWKDVLTEDVMVTEGMQKGRSAPIFDGGVFSPVMDSPTHCFHAWVAERLGS
ncbi:MAG: aromatic ring-hydroxylating dioxygenase subunit alpha [Paracoccaceae bacterium]